jgi:hypothetical protein
MQAISTSSMERLAVIPTVMGLRIGNVSVAVRGLRAWHDSELAPFVCEVETPDISVATDSSQQLTLPSSLLHFDSGALWILYRDGKDFVFDFASPALGRAPYKRMRVTKDFCRADITMSESLLGDRGWVSPLEYPADELLITNFLARRGLGVEVHGCGLIDPEAGGQLFLGHSGAGKSTTTRVWEYFRNPEVLSDDRLVLRINDGELWMYGTPWHGEAAFASPGKTKISRIFILQQGSRNQITGLSRAKAVGEIFARSFPPFHSAEGLEHTVGFLSRVVETVPCFEFQFVPDRTSVEAVLAFHG